jgi:hypothetical protein
MIALVVIGQNYLVVVRRCMTNKMMERAQWMVYEINEADE